MRTLVLFLALSLSMLAVERSSIFPPSAKPIGPYSPGILAGDYLYVSGQGARDANGKLPDTVEGQTKQCLENIKAIVEAAGLSMDHIVYTHVYLADIANYDRMNAAYATYFSDVLPARSTMGVTRMPTDTPVEISAIAIRDKSARQAVAMPSAKSPVPLSPGILTPDRFLLSGILGRDTGAGPAPATPQAQLDIAMKRLHGVLQAAQLDVAHLVYLNVYRTAEMPRALVEKTLHAAVPDAAISLIDVTNLPFHVSIGITGVAVRDMKQKRVFRHGETLCAAAGDTVYCAARKGAGAADALGAIDTGLKALGTNLTRAVANNVYLDDIENFSKMNAAYALAFPAPPPTRTTVQPMPAAKTGIQIAVVAVR